MNDPIFIDNDDNIETKNMFCPICKKIINHWKKKSCYCNEDQGSGYTYSDEYGDCNFCEDPNLWTCAKCNDTHLEGV